MVTYERLDKSRIALLIEDKIDAQFQPDQLGRYRTRGEAGVKNRKWTAFQVALAAPQSFIERQSVSNDFDAAFSFEEIAEFIRQSQQGLRGEYRADFLTTAAPRGAAAYVKFKDAETDAFWSLAYEMAQKEYSALEIREPNYASGANWIIFRPADIPTNIWTEFKGAAGVVDMMFYRTTIEELRNVATGILDDDMTILQVGKSPAIRLRVDRFFVSEGFKSAEPALRAGFSAAKRCIELFRMNQVAFSGLARVGRKKQ